MSEVNAKTLMERRTTLMNGLSGKDENAKRLKYIMYARFGDLANALYTDPVKEGLIRGNAEAFTVLTDPTICMWAFAVKGTSEEFNAAASKYPDLKRLFSSMQELQKGVSKIVEVCLKDKKDITFEEFARGLSTFKPDNIVPLMDDIETIDGDVEIDEEGYFDSSADEETDNEIEDNELDLEISNDIEDKSNYTNDEDELNPEVEANTARVMQVYKELFEVGFELQIPYGILVKEGILKISKDGKTRVQSSSSLSKLYELINDITGKHLVQAEIRENTPTNKLREIVMRSGTTYYPTFQLGNLYGILGDKKLSSWDDLNRELKAEVRTNIEKNIANGKDISAVVDALTTSIVVSEFNPNIAMKLRINIGNRLIKQGNFVSEYSHRKSTILAGTGEVYHVTELSSGVLEVILVFNKAAFNGRPLFAYEAVQDLNRRGRKPSIKELILGQDTSGKIMTVNMDRQNSCITLVGAGQRSGKGVLTLNLLGTTLASGCPLIYLDGKPDMAKVLWHLGNKHGIKPASWDIYDNNGNAIGNGAPEVIIRETSGVFGVLMYLKALQLMMVAAHLQATKGMKLGNGKRPFFIFDEALAVQTSMASVWPSIISLAKDKKNDSEEAEWCRTIASWAEQLSASLAGTINSQLPMSGISTVWLFQSVQPTSWKQFDTPGLSNKSYNILKTPIMSRMSVKILGKGTTDSEYGLGNKEIKGNKLITERVVAEGGRHFAYSDAQKITDMNLVKVFKPYLVLNEAENGTDSVEELRSNVSQDVWNAIAPDGHLHPGVGFEGFATLIGQDAIQNLSLGRQFLEQVMQAIGLNNYSSVDEYLYDASEESFKSLGTLLNMKDSDIDGTLEEDSDGTLYVTNGAQELTDNNIIPNKASSETPYKIKPPKGNVVDKQMEIERQAREAFEASHSQTNRRGYTAPYEPEESDDYTREDKGNYQQLKDNLVQAMRNGRISPEEAIKIAIDNRNNQATTMSGKGGRQTTIDVSQLRTYGRLNPDNSIDCRQASPGRLTWFEKRALDTPAGAEKYVKKIWNSILDCVTSNGYKKANITRVSIYGGQMYINGKILDLNGVIGGYESIRLRDIVSFKELFKKFFMVRELRIDEEILRVATMEFGENPMESFFTMANKLEQVIVQSENGSINTFDRSTVKGQTAKRLSERSQLENDIDMHCIAKNNSKWSERPAGNNIWGLRLAKQSMTNAGKAFMDSSKPSLGKAIIYTGTGILIGTLGTAAWGVTRLVKGIFGLGRYFKQQH